MAADPTCVVHTADGSVSLQVVEVLSDTELRAKALNSKVLGQRKNVNLPGVHVDLPVLGEQDIKDVQEFACRNKMDFIAASFVQTAEDVEFIRRVLEDAAGYNIKIISKIESQAGLQHYDSILDVSCWAACKLETGVLCCMVLCTQLMGMVWNVESLM
jgi:pyruvate kinase